MTKLEDPVIKTRDRGLRDHVSDLVTYWNKGKYSFTKSASSAITDTPSDVEIRFWASGSGASRIFVFIPGSASAGSGWWTLSLSEKTD